MKTGDGYTPLLYCCSFGVDSPALVRALLAAGADRDAAGGPDRLTPAMMAAKDGLSETLQLLLHYPPPAASAAAASATAASAAAAHGVGGVGGVGGGGHGAAAPMSTFVVAGNSSSSGGGGGGGGGGDGRVFVDLHATSKEATFKLLGKDIRAAGGKTALHFACEANEVACANMLLAAGADPRGRDDDGKSPFQYEKGCTSRLRHRRTHHRPPVVGPPAPGADAVAVPDGADVEALAYVHPAPSDRLEEEASALVRGLRAAGGISDHEIIRRGAKAGFATVLVLRALQATKTRERRAAAPGRR